MAQATDTVIIGAGQSGLALSRCLSARGIEHVLLERGRIGERWRSERWPSLYLLTPNWMTRLPGHRYAGPDPDGYMHKDEVARLLEGYARVARAPVVTGVTVESVSRALGAYHVATDCGSWIAQTVVIATGACDRPAVPAAARALSTGIVQVTPDRYRGPDVLPEGGVLVVGASATGAQLAREISRAGRAVTLATGAHTRVPRRYRGQDIFRWLDACGLLSEPRRPGTAEAAIHHPSFQLVGGPDAADIDLGSLAASGVRIAGRLAAASGHRVGFARGLGRDIAGAEARMHRLLDRIDAQAARTGEGHTPRAPRPAPFVLPRPPLELDLKAERIGSVIWATGYRRAYPWLRVPVLRPDGELRQTGGITAAPGLFVMGLPFMRRRNSTFIDGAAADAADIAEAVAIHLGQQSLNAA